MNAKQDIALEVCYSNSCVAKRLGVTKQEVEDIKRRNRRNPQSGDGVSDYDVSVGIGGFEIGGSLDGDFSLSIPGISLSVEDNGEGSISFPGNIRMDVVKDGCFFVKNFYFLGELAYQDVELDPNCEEEPEEDPEPPEFEDEDWDDSEDFNGDDPRLDEDKGEGFDEGDDVIKDNDIVVAIYGSRQQTQDRSDNYGGVYWRERTERRDVKRFIYSVRSWGVRKGVRYPHSIRWTETKFTANYTYRWDGGVEGSPTHATSDIIDYISYEFDPPACPTFTGLFEMGLGASIKAGAKQSRRRDRATHWNTFDHKSSHYYGRRDNSYTGNLPTDGYTCPYDYATKGRWDTYPSSPNRSNSYKYERKLIYALILEGDEDKGKPPGNIGKEPPKAMDKKCCKMLKEIHEALAVKELNEEGFQIPGRLIAPNATKPIKADNYLKILALQFQTADHLGLHPFKASLSDANAAQAGNQKIEIQFASGTAGLRQVVELLLENKGDAAARLNLQVRTAVAIAQVLKVATITSKTASAIASFIGMPLREKLSKIRMPFDVSLGKRRNLKGFDPTKQKEAAIEAIGVNEEASTEEILPEFLQTGEQPYIHEAYDGNFPNLIEQLRGQGRNG